MAVVEAVNDESLMADLENALAAGEEDEEFIEQDRQNQLLDAEVMSFMPFIIPRFSGLSMTN